MEETKPFKISKQIVKTAFERVKTNRGTYGVDEQSIADCEANLKDNLYKIWNRMSSGTYFPKPVKAVAIPKKNGGIAMVSLVRNSTIHATIFPLCFPQKIPRGIERTV